MRTLLVRAIVVVLALVACAWFALGARQAHDLIKASALITGGSGKLSRANAERARALLRSAAVLNPDRQIDLLRGQLDLRARHLSRAVRLFEGVTRSEPLNLRAWVLLASTAGRHPQLLHEAVLHIAQLDRVEASRR